VTSLPQALDRGAESGARGAARSASQVLDHGLEAVAQSVVCGDAALLQLF
jgi:hypothetical protein